MQQPSVVWQDPWLVGVGALHFVAEEVEVVNLQKKKRIQNQALIVKKKKQNKQLFI